jgi:HD-like signal output (HDOD) protein
VARVLFEASSDPNQNSRGIGSKRVGLDDIVRSIRSVPVAPEVLPKLQSKLMNVDTDVHDLTDLIKLDSGLTSSILRVSNSAYYGRDSQISSVAESITLIGYQETLRMVARCSYSTVMKEPLKSYGITGQQLWCEGVISAIAMEKLCERTGMDVAEGYVSGLLHAIGRVAINDYIVRSKRIVAPAPIGNNAAIVEWETNVTGFHSGLVGGAMLRQWRFAKETVEAVERQYAPTLRPDEPILCCLLPLAVSMAEFIYAQTKDVKEAPSEEEGGELDPFADLANDEEPEFEINRVDHSGLKVYELSQFTDVVRREWMKTRTFLR